MEAPRDGPESSAGETPAPARFEARFDAEAVADSIRPARRWLDGLQIVDAGAAPRASVKMSLAPACGLTCRGAGTLSPAC